ncbi:MAG: HAD-IIB family hydrolase [Deltaproteobacteria bacterium]|nr:HAD-IIB family hydrolase [Deltaproteobacteria bacterium]MBI2990623.1 HAD-IIB family hydrolase [Deltaproteobacteria bacterium]
MTPSAPIVITDLDGTLLDEKSYSYQASLPAIQGLKSAGIPLILCSSKTYSEILRLWRELDLGAPFIVENGGAIFFPPRHFPFPLKGAGRKDQFEVIELGTNVSILRAVLMETARECRAQIKSFGAMSPEEVSVLTGLPREAAELAMRREYDEPFLVGEGDCEALFAALRAKGFIVSQGDRFFHLTGNHDKGKAAQVLVRLYRQRGRQVFNVGLGNSANDLPLLHEVDRPILIRRADGSWDAEVTASIPGIQRTAAIGARGWREAIEEMLTEAGWRLC